MTSPRASLEPARMPLAELLDRWWQGATEAGFDAGGVTRALHRRALRDPLHDFLRRPSKLFRARLVDLGYVLAGGVPGACPSELPLAVEALHAGSLIVDDIEDDSDERRGGPALHKVHGTAVALNAANWLYFWPLVLLARTPLAADLRLRAHEQIARCVLRCHEGQALDLSVRIWDVPPGEVPEVVRAVTERKTGALLELACSLGAIAAGAERARVDAIGRFGREVGVTLQMLDDSSGVLVGARRKKGLEDFEQGKPTWVWAWLSHALGAEVYQALVRELLRGRPSLLRCLDRARGHLGAIGLRPVHAQRDRALAALREAGADDIRCRAVANELERLERSYAAT